MQSITTYLWFDQEARQAAQFYVSLFPGSRITAANTLNDTPSGTVETVSFELLGRAFQAISAGPLFKFNPSVSLRVTCRTAAEVDALWARLVDGGMALVPLDAYPFSERFGWVQDRYGLSWQLFFAGADATPAITPGVLVVGDVCGKAEEAVTFWGALFPDARIDAIDHYGPGEAPDKEGSLRYGAFSLLGQEFGAMDSAQPHQFAFNEAISFMVICDTQAEIDHYWRRLSAVPEAEQCGWLKDRYGLSWQIVPAGMEAMLGGDDRARADRVTQAFLKMKKIDIAQLELAARG